MPVSMRVARVELSFFPLLCSDVFIDRDFVLMQGAQTSGSLALPASRRSFTVIES